MIFREFIQVIIFANFTQKWQFKLENENFRIFRNSVNSYCEIVAGTAEAEWNANVVSIIILFTFLIKVIPYSWWWTIVTKIFFCRCKITRITLTDALIAICIDNGISWISWSTDPVCPSLVWGRWISKLGLVQTIYKQTRTWL